MTMVELEMKQSLIRKLMRTNDPNILERVKNLLLPTSSYCTDEESDILFFSDDLRNKIDIALKQADNGEVIDGKELDKQVKEWLAE